MSEPATESRIYRFTPNTPAATPPNVRRAALAAAVSTDQTLSSPEGRTASTDRRGNDEYSDENIRRWEEADKLDPELAQWVKAQLGE